MIGTQHHLRAVLEGAGPAQELGNGFIPAGLCSQEGFCELQLPQGGCQQSPHPGTGLGIASGER